MLRHVLRFGKKSRWDKEVKGGKEVNMGKRCHGGVKRTRWGKAVKVG